MAKAAKPASKPAFKPVAKAVAKAAPLKVAPKKAAASVEAPKAAVVAPVIEPEFKAGDKVVYPAHGVGSVESITAKVVGGFEQKYYYITIQETGMKIMVPVSQVTTVGLRKVVDSKTIEKVYDILRSRDVKIDTQTWNRRYREYTQKIKTGSVLEIARVMRDLTVLKHDKDLSFGERRMLESAKGLLVKEISIAKSSSEDAINAELQKICGLPH